MSANEFRLLVQNLFDQSDLERLLEGKQAVVLERIAFGGGATRWYCCHGAGQLPALIALLSPGSVVSLYLDGRIKRARLDEESRGEIAQVIAMTGEAVVGKLRGDGLEVSVDLVSGPNDLEDFMSTLCGEDEVFFGPFPARDNDRVHAVTLILPDEDGVVRPHPH